MKIAAEHPDADNPLLQAAARALERLGARVEIALDGDNLVRCIVAHDADELRTHSRLPESDARNGAPERSQGRTDGPVVVVCAQGLPNLMHELVHVVLAQRLADDHGIDYGQIPFRLEQRAGRRVLFEEIACSVLSCAYVSRPTMAARGLESPAIVRARVDAWFREQVEIQPVFYGDADDLRGFLQRVHAVTSLHAEAVSSVVELAYRRTEATLRAAGASDAIARPVARPTFFELWHRSGLAAASVADPTPAVGPGPQTGAPS